MHKCNMLTWLLHRSHISSERLSCARWWKATVMQPVHKRRPKLLLSAPLVEGYARVHLMRVQNWNTATAALVFRSSSKYPHTHTHTAPARLHATYTSTSNYCRQPRIHTITINLLFPKQSISDISTLYALTNCILYCMFSMGSYLCLYWH